MKAEDDILRRNRRFKKMADEYVMSIRNDLVTFNPQPLAVSKDEESTDNGSVFSPNKKRKQK